MFARENCSDRQTVHVYDVVLAKTAQETRPIKIYSSAYLIIRTIELVFSAGTVFFSHNNLVRTVFSVNSAKFQQAERDLCNIVGPMCWYLTSVLKLVQKCNIIG